MNKEIMTAFLNGFIALVNSFFRHAARSGGMIMVLVIANCGLILWIDQLNKTIRETRMEHKAEMAELRSEYRSEIRRLNAVIDSMGTRINDCHESLLKAEGEKAALLALLKQSKR